jgi:membrane protein YdbS with pleckstrin-like domain
MELQRLHPRALKFWRVQGLIAVIGGVLPGTIALGVLVGQNGPVWLATTGVCLVSGLSLFLAVWLPKLAYDRFGYAIRAHDFYVERGILIKRRTAIPLSRIQHVDTHQGPLEQLMKLSQLHVFTASGMSADGCLPGLSGETANELRDQLAQLGNAAAQEDGV